MTATLTPRHPTVGETGTATRLVLTVDARVYGGAENYVSYLLEHLPPTYDCTLLATEPVPHQLVAASRLRGVEVVSVPRVRHKADLRGQLRLIRRLRSTDPQLVHVNMADTANHRYALGAAHILGYPTVATLHTTTSFPLGVQGQALRFVFHRLRLAIAVSNEIAHHLRHRLGLPAAKVRTVANGIPATDIVERTHRSTEAVRVAAIGRLTDQKGFDLLLKAVAELVRLGRSVEVVIAGEGPDLAKLERLARGLPVQFAGFIDDTAALLAGIDILCLPSRWEGLPFVLLEAMMSGLPCVATAVGDVPEALGHAGVVVPSDDVAALVEALDRLIHSPEQRHALGRAAHDRVCARYSLQKMVDSTVSVYEEALTGRRPEGPRPALLG